MQCAGANVVFDGVDSPVTQTFGLGLFEELTPNALDTIERFFLHRAAHVDHEVSPLAGVAALDLLCARGYRPLKSQASCIAQSKPSAQRDKGPRHRPGRSATLGRNQRPRLAHGHPEMMLFMRQFGVLAAAKDGCTSFLAELDGQPGAAGALNIHEGVALFSGASTVPEMRRRGLQSALLQERMRYAAARDCDLAMMVAEAGGESQRNAERQGFRIAYTRTKWRLAK